MDHAATLRSLTGEDFSPRYLADECNMSVDASWARAQATMAAAARRGSTSEAASTLDAHIRVVHGADVLADSSEGEDAMCARFEAWVQQHYPARNPL